MPSLCNSPWIRGAPHNGFAVAISFTSERMARVRTRAARRQARGLFRTEVIRRQGPWRHLEAVEVATLDWVEWFNTRRLLEPIGYVPPAEYEARYYQQAKVA